MKENIIDEIKKSFSEYKINQKSGYIEIIISDKLIFLISVIDKGKHVKLNVGINGISIYRELINTDNKDVITLLHSYKNVFLEDLPFIEKSRNKIKKKKKEIIKDTNCFYYYKINSHILEIMIFTKDKKIIHIEISKEGKIDVTCDKAVSISWRVVRDIESILKAYNEAKKLEITIKGKVEKIINNKEV